MKNIFLITLSLLALSLMAKPKVKEEPIVMKLQATTSMPKSSLPAELDPPIPKGAMINVDSYDVKSKTYSITIVSEEGAGPNIAMPIDLAKAIGSISEAQILGRPELVVGNSYALKEELRLLSELGLEVRTDLVKRQK